MFNWCIGLQYEPFGKLLILFFLNKGKSTIFYSMAQSCCLLHLIKQNYLLKHFLRTQILKTQVSVYLVSLLELIWNCIMNLDLPKVSGFDCVPVVVLKDCETELPHRQLNSSIIVWRSLVFQIVERSHQWSSLYVRMSGKGLHLKTTRLLVFIL